MMWIALSPFAAGVLEIAGFVGAVQLSVSRYRALGLSILVGAAAGAYTFAQGATSISVDDGIGYAALALLAFFSISLCFWAVINLAVTAVRIRLLREVWLANGRRVPVRELSVRYGAEEMLVRRLERLEKSGYIVIEDATVKLRSSGISKAIYVIDVVKRIFVPRGGA